MIACSRIAFIRFPIILAVVLAAPLSAQTEEVPVVDVPPLKAEPPVVEVEPPQAEVQEEQAPPAEEAGIEPGSAPVSTSPAADVSASARRIGNAPDLPPLPSASVGTDPLATVPLPSADRPVAVVPNASGTPIVVQPPLIEPPEVIDDPWTIARALPWLFAGLLIGGSLAILLFQRRRRRIIVHRRALEEGADRTEPEPSVEENRPNVLVRKVRRPTGERTAAPR